MKVKVTNITKTTKLSSFMSKILGRKCMEVAENVDLKGIA